jgi:Uma2 family endonuclease
MQVMTLPPPPTKLITGEELAEQEDIGLCELIEGRIVSMSPVKGGHGLWEARVIGYLFVFDPHHKLGWVLGGEVGVYTKRNPDTVRGMDAAFISRQRHPARPDNFLEVAPELVVEVISPYDRWSEIQNKLNEYFAIGVERVWLVDPPNQVVYVYRTPTESVRLTIHDTLHGEGVLEAFSLGLADLFVE